MAWTAPKTWALREELTSADMNTYVRDNLKYLHGDAGTVTLGGGVVIPNASWYYVKDSAGIAQILIGLFSDNAIYVGDNTRPIYLRGTGGQVQVNGMPVQRHPYSTDHHVESSNVSIGGVSGSGSVAVTFTDPFVSVNVVATAQNIGVVVSTSAFSGTGCTLNVRDLVNSGTSKTVVVGYMSEGSDS